MFFSATGLQACRRPDSKADRPAGLSYILAAAVLAGGAGCARRASTPVERLAILRFENLGADPAADWMGRALADAVSRSLAGASSVSAISTAGLHGFDRALGTRATPAPGVSSERAQALVAGASRIGYGVYRVRGGVLEARLTLEDAASNRTLEALSASGPAADVVGVAEALARPLGGAAGVYGTRNPAAVRSYAAAVEAASPEATMASLADAVKADPAFAPAQILLAQWSLSRQDRAGAERILRDALQRAAAMPPADRARLELETAALRGDRDGQRRALEALAKATPNDPAVWRSIAEAATGRREHRAAVEAYRKALAVDPRDATLLNAFGYAAASAGDLKAAAEALERYRALRPNDANPYDSLGDVHFQVGRLREAEQFYLQAHEKDPAFLGGGTLYKAALARLMTGDVASADGLASKYAEARQAAGDPALEYRKAEWSWISGRRREGFQRLAAFAAKVEAGPLRELAARAYAQLAVWSLTLGNRQEAEAMAARAMPLAGPASGALASMARFLTLPPASASEWALRAERVYADAAQAQLKLFARAYALLLAKEYEPAAALLRQMYESGDSADNSLPVLLAWTYLETGKASEAAALLGPNPTPTHEGLAPLAVMTFPRLFYLRGVLAEKQGKAEAARREYRIFLQLSGSEPLAWGEEKAAAARMAR